MDGALGRDVNIGESPDQALADFTGAPTGVLALHVQDKVFHLKRKLMGIAIGTAVSVCQPLNAACLISIKNLVARFAGDSILPAKFRHGLCTDGVYDGSDKEERQQLENVMRDHHVLSAKEICNALLEYAVKKDDHLRQIGEQDRIDDKTVFIIKRN
jgi:hypothetical protein